MNNKFLAYWNKVTAFVLFAMEYALLSREATCPLVDKIKSSVDIKTVGGNNAVEKNTCLFKNWSINLYYHKPTRGLEPKISLKFENYNQIYEFMRIFSLEKLVCTIWDDVRTYLKSPKNNKEISALKVAINYFKEKD